MYLLTFEFRIQR